MSEGGGIRIAQVVWKAPVGRDRASRRVLFGGEGTGVLGHRGDRCEYPPVCHIVRRFIRICTCQAGRRTRLLGEKVKWNYSTV